MGRGRGEKRGDKGVVEPREFEDFDGGKHGRKKRRQSSVFIDDVAEEDDDEEDEESEYSSGMAGSKKQRRRSSVFIDDVAEEDDDEEEEEESQYLSGKLRLRAKQFLDDEAEDDDDAEEDDDVEEADDDFIDYGSSEILDKDDGSQTHHQFRAYPEDDREEDIDALQNWVNERYSERDVELEEELTEVEQQDRLPTIKDPKLWRVMCKSGREREVAFCLMQKYFDKRSQLKIRSAVALDHIKNYIYVEADKEAHVREACRGFRNLNCKQIMLVPLKEMTDVLFVKPKAAMFSEGSWVRMRNGTYKGDLAKVVRIDNMRQKVEVKLFLSNNLQNIVVGEDSWENDFHMAPHSKDGFLLKEVSFRSVNACSVHPTIDELEKFLHSSHIGNGDRESLFSLSINRKKRFFFKGDRVIVVKGDLKNLKGTVEKVEEDSIYLKPDLEYHLDSLAVSDKELCKYFAPGNHVKIIAGRAEGKTGFVVSVEGHAVNILSDITKENLRVFADNVMETSEVVNGVNQFKGYELDNLVQLNDMNFGAIIHIDKESFQVLKGSPGKPEVAIVKPGEIRCKLDRIKCQTNDQLNRHLSVNDLVKVVEGIWSGRTGRIVQIFKGNLFIYDPHHLEHSGLIFAKSQSCILVADGPRATKNWNGVNPGSCCCALLSEQRSFRGYPSVNGSGRYGGPQARGGLIGAFIKICKGVYKGHKGRVKEIEGKAVKVELEAQMRVVLVGLDEISDNVNVSVPSRYGLGSETPVHPSQTPLHPCMTPMADHGVYDGAMTPVHGGA